MRPTIKYILICLFFIVLPIVSLSIEPVSTTIKAINEGTNSSNFRILDIAETKAGLYIANYFIISVITLIIYCYLHLLFSLNIINKLKNNALSIMILWNILAGLSIIHINSYFYPQSDYFFASDFFSNPLASMILWCINIPPVLFAIYIHKKSSILVILFLTFQTLTSNIKNNQDKHENIFLIGIDSLRPELISEYMPFLSKQLKESTTLPEAYTPFARTYPAWNAILTGRHPVNNGARFNLQNEDMLNKDNLYLPQLLKNMGYQTIYATDERRFSNLGSAQGFEKIIGPRTGASDFILGTYADFPTTNLLLLMPFAKSLLPELYANRASHHLYRPSSFNLLLNSGLKKFNHKKPVFMATHFCLPHWPYTFVGHTSSPEYKTQPNYPANLKAVDLQIEQFMKNLQQLGLLDNSILIFLSDHGESWGAFKTDFTNSNGESYNSYDYGHGMNILSSNSHKVLLSIKGIDINQDNEELPSSLIDITPTILDELKLLDSLNQDFFDGRSLKRPPSHQIELTFESGVILAEANVANPNPRAVARAGSHRFTIRENGALRLKDEMIKDMISAKQKGLRIGNHGLFYMKKSTDDPWIYIDYTSNYFEQTKKVNPLAPVALVDRFCRLYANEDKTLNKSCTTKQQKISSP